jgi:hypothetical protein
VWLPAPNGAPGTDQGLLHVTGREPSTEQVKTVAEGSLSVNETVADVLLVGLAIGEIVGAAGGMVSTVQE